jgi:hypothetical protein
MPSPTPPREVRCEACGASHPHSTLDPMPMMGMLSIRDAVRWLLETYGCCVPGCTGCGFPKATR